MFGCKQFSWPAWLGLLLFVWGTTEGNISEQLHIHLTGYHLLEFVATLCSYDLVHFTEQRADKRSERSHSLPSFSKQVFGGAYHDLAQCCHDEVFVEHLLPR